MAGYKNITEENVLDYVLNNEKDPGEAVGVFYLGMYLTDPSHNTNGVEVTTTGTAYARQQVTLTRTGQVLSNTNQLTFPEALADWGTVVAFAIHKTVAGVTDDQVMYGSLDASKTVVTGEQILIEIGQFTQTID